LGHRHGQIIVILIFALLFFGAKKLPELARGLGQGIKEFKKASREMQDEIRNSSNEEPPPPPAPKREEPPKTAASSDETKPPTA